MFSMPVTLTGKRLILPGRKPRHLQAFIEALPHVRWNDKHESHSCDATAGTAWHILSHAQECNVLPSDEVIELSNRFLKNYQDFRDDGSQPQIRVKDSWEHQRQAFWFAYHRDAALFDMWMGTGKSKPTVELIVNKGCKTVLILCPSAVLGVWRREVRDWAGDFSHDILIHDKKSWNVKRKRDETEKFMRIANANGKAAIIAINYESAWREPFAKWALSQKWDMAICDESHNIANHDTKACKFASELGMVSKSRICLSGTPLSKDPLSIFGQALFLDRGVYGASWPRFRATYGKSGPFGVNQIVGYKDLDILSEKMSLFTFSAGEEVLDLPEMLSIQHILQFEPTAQKIYKQFEKECIAEIGEDGGLLTAENVLVKLIRLQQMTSGMVPLDEEPLDFSGEIQPDPREWVLVSEQKKNALHELLLDIPVDEPAVVFCKFKQDLKVVREIAEKTGRRYGEISGDQKDLTPDAKMPDWVDLMGVQIQSGGVGIDLTRARYEFYYSPGHSLANYLQSLARIYRPGQTRSVFCYYLIVEGTVDEAVYKALDKRQEINDVVISYLKELQKEQGLR